MQFTTTKAKEIAKNLSDNDNLDIKTGACLVSVTVSGSCGQRIIPKSKVEFEGESLDSSLLKGTTLQWFPSKSLSFVNRTSQAVSRLLTNYGIGWGKSLTMVPLERLEDLARDLETINEKFNESLSETCSDYDSIIEDHKLDNPDVKDLIERFKLDVSEFQSRFIFKVEPPMAMTPLFDEDADEITKNASDTLWNEVAETAHSLHSKSFFGQEKVSQKAVSAVKKLRTKLLGLSFLNSGMDNVIDAFDDVLSQLPKRGYVEGALFHQLGHFLSQISASNCLKALADGVPLAQPEVEEDEQEDELVEELPQLDEDFVSDDDYLSGSPQITQQSALELTVDDFGMF